MSSPRKISFQQKPESKEGEEAGRGRNRSLPGWRDIRGTRVGIIRGVWRKLVRTQ